MKKLLLICFIIFLGNVLSAQTLLVTEDFETDGESVRYTSNTFNIGNTDYFTRYSDGGAPAMTNDPTGESGTFYWVGEDCDNASGGTGILTLNSVSINGFTSSEVRVLLAIGRDGGDRFEIDDELLFQYNIDGSGWTTFGAFYGGFGGFNSSPTQDVDLNGTPDGPNVLTIPFQEFTFPIPATGNNMQIRFIMGQNAGTEELAVDNIRVFGLNPVTPVGVAITSNTSASCNGSSDGSLTATASDGTTPYSYLWSNGASSSGITGPSTITNLFAGTYTVTVTDNTGGTATESATITQPFVLVAATAVDANVSCNGSFDGGTTASATGGTMPYTYAWSNGATSAPITGLAAATYTVTITDANGCTDTETATITQPAVVVAATAVDTNVSCNGSFDGGVTASATGGTMPYTYTWSNGATTAPITGLAAGTYTVTITDANGCTDSESTSVTEPTAVVSSATVTSAISCNGATDEQTIASATGGTTPYTYSWNTGATTATQSGFGAGTYSVTITDANGCTDTSSVMVTEPTALVAAAAVNANVSCNGDSDGGTTASATGGTTPYTYIWSNAATTATNTSLASGTYTVTITDANGCTDTESAIITEPFVLVAATAVDANVSCNGDSDGGTTASATGGTMPYTYTWSNGATTAPITGLAAGTYTVTITDANGCTDSESTSINEPAVVVATATVDANVSCNGDSDGGTTASATGGTMPYTYSWNTGETTATQSGYGAGTYTVTITDANGCTDTESTSVTEPNALVAATAVDANVSCNGGFDGGATASATGGTMPYTYTWSNGATTAPITGLAAATYTVTITDANGCTNTDTATITQPAVVVAAAAVDTNVSCNGGFDGGVTASGTGGTMPYTYAWSNGATTAPIAGLAAGTYTVTVTDANGCTDSESTSVTEPTALVASTVVDINDSGSSDGEATGSATGGTMPYTYLWSNGATTASITGLAAGTYTLSVTDANGCGPDTSMATITLDPLLSIDDLTDQLNVSIYPNPAKDNITLSFDKNTQAQIQIIDLVGKVVTTEKANNQVINISVSHLTPGIYFVKIDSNQNTGFYRIIKK